MGGSEDFLAKLDAAAVAPVNESNDWLATCQRWKKEYPAVLPRQWDENGETANVYAFVRYLSSRLPENSLTARFQWRMLRGWQSGVCDSKRQPYGEQ